MRKTSFKLYTTLTISCLVTLAVMPAVYAQGQDKDKKDDKGKKEWSDGEIESVEIEIVKERQITLPPANRNFEKIPPRPYEGGRPSITYDFRPFTFKTPELAPQIKPLKLKQQEGEGVYGNYVSLGYGNYASPYLEAFLNSRKDKSKLIGAHAWHSSSGKGPVDGKNSGSGMSGISLFGKTFGESITFSGNIGFENSTTHFYGYPADESVDRDTIRQSYNIFSLGGSVSNTRSTDFSYQLGADFSYLADKYDARETEVNLNFKSSYKIDDESSAQLHANYFVISRKDNLVDPKPRNIFTIGGAYMFLPEEILSMKVGLNVTYENDTLDNKNLHVYPDVAATYKVSPSVDVVGALTGGVDKVSLHTLSRENWWLGPNIPIYNTNRLYELQVGINARLGKKVEAHGGLGLAAMKDLYFYVNMPEDQSKFTTVYDKGTTKRSNLYGSLSYAQSEKAKFMLRADYYAYNTADIEEAWHRPSYRVSANASLNVYDKILLKSDLIMQGGMKALDVETGDKVTLDAAFDLNVRAEYLFSKSFSFFVQLNNITSSKYPVFLNYPVRGIQVMGGLTWSF